MKRIALHKMFIYNHNAVISTVQLGNTFETMVMFDDGDELDCIRTESLDEAKTVHNKLVHKYNDMIYDGSIQKHLGVANVGQFVKTVVAC